MRFHARGEAKVEAVHRAPEMALEEHLILIWPAGADPGESPVWDEVTGVPSDDPWTIDSLGEYTRIKTPLGYYRLVTWQHEPQAAAVTPAPAATDQPGLSPDGSGGLVVATGTTRSCEITVEGSDQQRRDALVVGGWQVVAEANLDLADPLRLVDGLGQVPRRMPDPLLPPGSWTFRLLTRGPDSEQNVTDPGHVYDQRIQIWPRDAPVWQSPPVYRHYQVDEDGTRYLVEGLDPDEEGEDGTQVVLIQFEN